jgi:hypothetical protein
MIRSEDVARSSASLGTPRSTSRARTSPVISLMSASLGAAPRALAAAAASRPGAEAKTWTSISFAGSPRTGRYTSIIS